MGFTKLLGAPGEDGVYRYTPSPVEAVPADTDDSDEVAHWFTTAADPAVAAAVAEAEAEARESSMPAITVPPLEVSSARVYPPAG